jgi:hypothetical protein
LLTGFGGGALGSGAGVFTAGIPPPPAGLASPALAAVMPPSSSSALLISLRSASISAAFAAKLLSAMPRNRSPDAVLSEMLANGLFQLWPQAWIVKQPIECSSRASRKPTSFATSSMMQTNHSARRRFGDEAIGTPASW